MDALAGRDRAGSGRGCSIAARTHLGADGAVTVLSGKVEMGRGARAELTQAAAEELRVAPSRIEMVLGDTSQTPDDGITAGSRTTPSTVPAVREAAAAVRQVLVELACRQWGVEPGAVVVPDFGSGFGGKHTGEAAVEAARSA